MRLNLRQLSKKLVWGYLNTKLLKEVDEETLSSHNISLHINCSTALRWMKKCKAGWCDTKKTYYNDQHQNSDVIKSRVQYIETLELLQKILRVWVVLLKVEQDNCLEVRDKPPFSIAMPVRKDVVVDNVSKYVHHMDDQGD